MNSADNYADYSDLKVIFLNCTFKPTPRLSHTQGLIDKSRQRFEQQGISVKVIRPVD